MLLSPFGQTIRFQVKKNQHTTLLGIYVETKNLKGITFYKEAEFYITTLKKLIYATNDNTLDSLHHLKHQANEAVKEHFGHYLEIRQIGKNDNAQKDITISLP